MESQVEIQEHLKRYADTYAFSKGFKFGLGADQDIFNLAGVAAGNVINPKSEYQGTPKLLLIGLAEKQLALLVDNMIIAYSKVYNETEFREDNVIGERTLVWAKKSALPDVANLLNP